MTLVFIGPAFTGCERPEPPPVAYAGPTLACGDLGLARTVEAQPNGYVVLDETPSQGRFPARLAVVRLDKPNPLFVCDDPLFAAERGWEIATLKEEEATIWNTLLKTVPRVQAVAVMDRSATVSPDCDLKQVIESVRRLGTELCLIYGPRMVPDDCAGLAGVIVDAATGQYVAYVQSQAGAIDFEPPRPDRSKYDRSHQDVNYLAARRFERQVRNCVLDLIGRDQPPVVTQPSPWRDSQELRLPPDSVPVYIVPNHRMGE
ncbi:MAG: hypothetical protein HY718_14745 [Planctomycetes bacterium]|nr:hypothetical protein [Planctomycetota bacterium]